MTEPLDLSAVVACMAGPDEGRLFLRSADGTVRRLTEAERLRGLLLSPRLRGWSAWCATRGTGGAR